MWFKEHMPAVYEKARSFLMPMDYVLMRLTGAVVTDHSMAAGSMCYSLEEKTWCQEIIAAAGVRPCVFPPVRWAGEVAGTLTKEAAQKCGLTTACLAVIGGQDQKVAAHGARNTADAVTLSLGTCGCFEFMTDSCEKDERIRLPLCPHVSEGRWTLEACMNTSGGAIKWVRDTICCGLSYDEMDELAEKAPIGSRGVRFYPYLAGSGNPHANAEAQTGSYRSLTLGAGREDLVRSLFEGIAYECRMNIEEAEKKVSKVRQINAFSGGSKAAILCRIIADVTGRTVRAYTYPEMGNLGAAALAAAAAGLDSDTFGSAVLDSFTDYVPGENRAQYDALYREYCRECEM